MTDEDGRHRDALSFKSAAAKGYTTPPHIKQLIEATLHLRAGPRMPGEH